MNLQWSGPARRDLLRLYDFLREVNPRAAKAVFKRLEAAAEMVVVHPHIAPGLEGFEPRNVRSLIVSDYEMRYEVKADMLIILRIWHTREDR